MLVEASHEFAVSVDRVLDAPALEIVTLGQLVGGHDLVECGAVQPAHAGPIGHGCEHRDAIVRPDAEGFRRAVEVLRGIVDHVDVLVGNEEDLQKGLGIAGPEVAGKSKLDPAAFVRLRPNRFLRPH